MWEVLGYIAIGGVIGGAGVFIVLIVTFANGMKR